MAKHSGNAYEVIEPSLLGCNTEEYKGRLTRTMQRMGFLNIAARL